MRIQRKPLLLIVLFGMCSLCVIIGFAVVGSPVTITFDARGIYTGTGGQPAYTGESVKSIKSSPASGITLPTPIWPGYRFEGWSTSLNGNVISNITAKNTKLYAKWVKQDITASLYLDGQIIRDAKIPDPSVPGYIDLGNNSSTGFLLTNSADYAFDTNGFQGWEYYNEQGDKIHLEYVSGYSWNYKRNNVHQYVINQSNPLVLPPYNIALNAVIGTYKQINIVFKDGNSTIGSAITQRLNTSLTPGQFPSLANLVGWRLVDTMDIYQTTHGNFFLDPRLYEICTDKTATTATLTFYAVKSTDNGKYDKKFEDGRVTLTKTGTNPAGVTITDLTAPTVTAVNFDFGKSFGTRLKNITSAPAANQPYPAVLTANREVSASPVNGFLRLPLANNYAIPGMTFEGWRCSLDGRVYPAGLYWQIPRGIGDGGLSFTAVWVDSNILVSFNLDGGSGLNVNAYDSKRAGDKITWTSQATDNIKKPGYVFSGWRGLTNYALGAEITVHVQKQRLTAIWTPITQDITIGLTSSVPNHSQQLEDKKVKVGDVVYLERVKEDDEFLYEHYGWRFQDLTKTDAVWVEYYFGAPFIESIMIILDENFLRRHLDTRPGATPNTIKGLSIEPLLTD